MRTGKFHPSVLSILFIICEQVLTAFIQQNTVNVSDCFASSLNSPYPNCTISTYESEGILRSECAGGNGIKVWVKNTTALIHCKSEKFIVVDGIFSGQRPRWGQSYVHVERSADNVSDPSTYTHHVKLISEDHKLTVKYLIGHGNPNGTGQVHNVVEIIIFGMIWDGGVWWLGNQNFEIAEFEANREIVEIPCIPELKYRPGMLNILKNKTQLLPLEVDDTKISLNPIRGFQFNTTLFPDYNQHLYRCLPIGTENLYYDFRIPDLPDLKVAPLMPNRKDDRVHRIFVSRLINRAPITLECQHSGPIRLEGKLITNAVESQEETQWLINFYFYPGYPVDSLEANVVNPIESNRTKYEQTLLPKPRYAGTYTNMLQAFDRLLVNCTSVSTGLTLYSWDVSVHDASLQNTGPHFLKFYQNEMPEGPEDFDFQCYSRIYDDIRLKSIKCSNFFQCNLLERCFNDDYRCNQAVLSGSACPETWMPDKSCQQIKAQRPGALTLCTAGGYMFKQLHFVGFDNVIYNYYDKKFPANALVRLKMSRNELYTLESVAITCSVHQFFSEGRVTLIFMDLLGNVFEQNPVSVLRVNASEQAPHAETFEIVMRSASVKKIQCVAPHSVSSVVWFESNLYPINVTESVSPEILSEAVDTSLEDGAEGQTIECKASGLPLPLIQWHTEKMIPVKITPDIEQIKSSNGSVILNFKRFKPALAGIYICTASNVAGFDSMEFNVQIKKDMRPTIIALSISGAVILMLLPLLLLYIRYRKTKKFLLRMTEAEVSIFFNGTPGYDHSMADLISTDLQDEVEAPFKKEFEIKKDDIEIGIRIGSGKFGEVYLAVLAGSPDQVALKMTSPRCPDNVFKALRKELKIMTNLGEHPNLIRLLGAYVAEIEMGKLYIFTEYCSNGDLLAYLQKNARYYGGNTGNQQQSAAESKSPYKSMIEVMSFGFTNLVRWASEIASGMRYLSNLKVVHRDLAARNILLTNNLIAKIGDFGLSRRLYERVNYVKVGEDYIPWQWYAIECVQCNTFSMESDVWAYGILLWEIFSLGGDPYPGLEWSIEFGNQLKNGLRNTRPAHATADIYEVMCLCWSLAPEGRPSFEYLEEFFGHQADPFWNPQAGHYMLVSECV